MNMKNTSMKAILAVAALCVSGAANAGFGVGFKAGTLGLGLEGRWSPIPWIDIRAGFNKFDYEDNGYYASVDYDATLALETTFLTANIKFPLSPLRVTVGAYSNGNEFQLASKDTLGLNFDIGGGSFLPADVGTLISTTSFEDIAPYLGVGFDFEVFGKVGLNLDLGVLWQDEPIVTLEAVGLASAPPAVQAILIPALEAERQLLEDEMSSLKAYPVISLAFIYNF